MSGIHVMAIKLIRGTCITLWVLARFVTGATVYLVSLCGRVICRRKMLSYKSTLHLGDRCPKYGSSGLNAFSEASSAAAYISITIVLNEDKCNQLIIEDAERGYECQWQALPRV